MDIREEFETRVKRLESFVEEKGLGSKQLKKVKKIQRTINGVVLLGTIITVAGIAIWAVNRD